MRGRWCLVLGVLGAIAFVAAVFDLTSGVSAWIAVVFERRSGRLPSRPDHR